MGGWGWQDGWRTSVRVREAYLWDSNKDVVEWLEKQQAAEMEGSRSLIEGNIKYIRRDSLLKQLRGLVLENPEVAMDSIIHLTQHISPTQRAEVLRLLTAVDSSAPS
ncbi:acetyl-CoA carboxylase-like [Denticeps clupeoides]|uniref:acetyl-CoA carboxylase-like n=1 Tax=Denticeps clupeoides TaxID=299321 RepID=UPI0010A4468E|nr:acetyl-CoA carboxylase-like [Denticeps clupeoides]